MPRLFARFWALIALFSCGAAPALAADSIDAADTGFMIICTGFVLMMTLPGLALFYSGMVRKKHVLAVMAQSAAATALISL